MKDKTASEKAEELLTQKVGDIKTENGVSKAIDISMILTIAMTLLSSCKNRSGSASAAINNVREMSDSRKKRILRKQMIRDYGSRSKWIEAGGWDLVNSTLSALDDADDNLLAELIVESEADNTYLE